MTVPSSSLAVLCLLEPLQQPRDRDGGRQPHFTDGKTEARPVKAKSWPRLNPGSVCCTVVCSCGTTGREALSSGGDAPTLSRGLSAGAVWTSVTQELVPLQNLWLSPVPGVSHWGCASLSSRGSRVGHSPERVWQGLHTAQALIGQIWV